ncbi:MAG: hypothetical protein ABEJ94_11080 [Halorientalis sp.]
MTDPVELVAESLSPATRDAFEERVDEQAAFLRDALARGDLDTEGFAIGLELEVYAVDGDGRLTTVPDGVFEECNGELGLHNAELNTDPDPFTAAGLDAQARALETRWERARAAARDHGCDLVLDAMWTRPPAEGSVAYLGDTDDHDGTDLPSNMRSVPRYWAIDRHCLDLAGGAVPFEVPGASVEFPTILFESLATSIQPHVQIPDASEFPRYHDIGVRTLGPVLALATNSPFLPGDMYDDGVDPEELLAETHHELRIAAFEQSVNHTDPPKCRVPDDLDDPADAVDHVVEDPLLAPFLAEWVEGAEEGFTGEIWEFDHKRGTFWRWLRGVIGGDHVDGIGGRRSIRIEYRPLPTQPSIRDIVGFQALVGGLLRGLVAADHPLGELDRDAAERSFYAAVEDGLDADLAWITAEGERTSDSETIFAEVFEYARRGLAEQSVDDATADRYLDPLEARWDARTTPSQWKIDRVRAELDAGATLAEALAAMQEEYARLSRERDTFADWL